MLTKSVDGRTTASFDAVFTTSFQWSIILFLFSCYSFFIQVDDSVDFVFFFTIVFIYIFSFCVRSCFYFCGFPFPALDCGQPHPLQNGSITGGSTVYPNVMHFNCDEGFILHGSSKIQCQTNGTWSKTSSFCDGKL